MLEWFRVVGEDLVVDLPKGRPLCCTGEYLSEVGRPDLGCKEVEGGGKLCGEMLRILGGHNVRILV